MLGRLLLERLCAPISNEAFQRFAQTYGLTPRLARLYGFVSALVAAILIIGACMMLGLTARWHFLKSYGLPATAVADHVSTRVEIGRHRVKTTWENIQYSYKTDKGEVVHSAIDRPAAELTTLTPEKFPVVYWGSFPSVNTPLDFQPPDLPIAVLSLFLLACAPYFILFSRRAFYFSSHGSPQREGSAANSLR